MSDLEDATTTELARELARRRRSDKVCAWPACGKTFSGYPTQKWCSRRCAGASFYQDHKAERDAARARYPRKPTARQRAAAPQPEEPTP